MLYYQDCLTADSINVLSRTRIIGRLLHKFIHIPLSFLISRFHGTVLSSKVPTSIIPHPISTYLPFQFQHLQNACLTPSFSHPSPTPPPVNPDHPQPRLCDSPFTVARWSTRWFSTLTVAAEAMGTQEPLVPAHAFE